MRCGLAGVLTYRVAPGSTGPGQPASAHSCMPAAVDGEPRRCTRTVAVSAGLQLCVLDDQGAPDLEHAKIGQFVLEIHELTHLLLRAQAHFYFCSG